MSRADDGGQSCRNGSAPTDLYHGISAWRADPWEPDLTLNVDSPFFRRSNDKLIRRSHWLDMDDRTLVTVMVNGIGANLTNDEKTVHLVDLRREHRIDKVCIQEILPPEK